MFSGVETDKANAKKKKIRYVYNMIRTQMKKISCKPQRKKEVGCF